MGRYIYADTVGSSKDKDDPYVYKFWFAVQPSDVSDYLEVYEAHNYAADLSIEDEAAISKKVAELKEKFEKKYGTSYENFMEDAVTEHTMPMPAGKLASRINLGEHLLATIANMKAAGIDEQILTIEY
jgi:hypothetical protein